MERFKLKIGLGSIPFIGFVIVLFWGTASTYAINRKRMQVWIYAAISILGMIIISIPVVFGIYFFIQNADPSNPALVTIIALLIVLVGLYFMTAFVLAVQYFYCKKLVARRNMQYLS